MTESPGRGRRKSEGNFVLEFKAIYPNDEVGFELKLRVQLRREELLDVEERSKDPNRLSGPNGDGGYFIADALSDRRPEDDGHHITWRLSPELISPPPRRTPTRDDRGRSPSESWVRKFIAKLQNVAK